MKFMPFGIVILFFELVTTKLNGMKTYHRHFVVFLIAILPIAVLGQSNWRWQNPNPQGNDIYDVQYIAPDTLVSVGMAGTVLKSTDDGESWEHMPIATSSHLKSVCFVDGQTGWAAGGSNGWTSDEAIIKTTDGGLTWNLQTTGTYDHFESIYFIDDQIGWAAGGLSVFKTIDGGANWVDISTPTITNDLYGIHFTNADTGYAAGLNGAFYRSFDGGTNWSTLGTGTTSDYYDIWFLNDSTGWAVGENEQIRITTDYGFTWTTQHQEPGTDNVWSIAFTDADTGYAAGREGLYYTYDGGANWQITTTIYQDLPNPRATAFNGGTKGVVVSQYGGIQKTTNAGASLYNVVTGVWPGWLETVFFIDEYTGWAAGDQGVLRTDNGGETWTEISNSQFTDIFFIDQNIGYGLKNSGTIFKKTTNGGASWSNATSGLTGTMQSMFFIDEFTGWAVGLTGRIFKTTDGAGSWTQQVSTTTSFLQDVQFLDADTGYVASGAGYLLKTVDGGANWAQMPTGFIFDNYVQVHFLSPDTGWFTHSSQDVYYTYDGAQTFARATTPCPSDLDALVMPTNMTGYTTGSQYNWACNFFETTDGGLTWDDAYFNFGYDFNDIFCINDTTCWAVGNYGAIIKTGTTPMTGSVVTANDVSCNGDSDGSASVTAFGGVPGYTYSWPTGGTGTTETGLSAGSYDVWIYDSAGDSTLVMVTITEPAPLAPTINATNISCNGDDDGVAIAVVPGGTSPYTYLWSNGWTSSGIGGLAPGNYWVTVTDANGCSETSPTITITEPPALTATITPTDPSIGNCDGAATANPTGGVSPYTYAWNLSAGSQTTQTATNLCAGTHGLWITDANGCTYYITITLTEVMGIEENDMNIQLTAFPNPTATEEPVLIMCEQCDGMTLSSIRVYDHAGRLIMTEAIGEDHNGSFLLPVTELAAGTYEVQLWNEEQVVAGTTIIKSR